MVYVSIHVTKFILNFRYNKRFRNRVLTLFLSRSTPQHGWNIDKVGVKHQSINQFSRGHLGNFYFGIRHISVWEWNSHLFYVCSIDRWSFTLISWSKLASYSSTKTYYITSFSISSGNRNIYTDKCVIPVSNCSANFIVLHFNL